MDQVKEEKEMLSDSRFRHGKQGEEKVKEVLKNIVGKDDRLLNNVVLQKHDGTFHQIDHILLRHNGLYCIETKHYAGNIHGRYNDSRWTVHNPYTRNITTFLNPMRQNFAHVSTIQSVIGHYYVESLIVFSRGELHVLGYGVLKLNELESYVNQKRIYPEYNPFEIEQLYKMIKEKDISNKISPKEIAKQAKDKILKIKNDMICPRCGAPLIIKNGIHGPFYSCSRFPDCNFSMDIDEDNNHKKR